MINGPVVVFGIAIVILLVVLAALENERKNK